VVAVSLKTMEIYDLQGKLVQKLAERTFESGVSTVISLDAHNLISGMYVIRLISGEGVVTQRFQVMK